MPTSSKGPPRFTIRLLQSSWRVVDTHTGELAGRARYTVEIRGVRNVTGVSGDVVGTLVIPERVARDTLAPADTLRQPGDTVPIKPAPRKPAPTKPAPTRPAPTQPAPARPR